ncbi:MAG TPA: nucleoside deaminase [Candidatus Saccharimonadia bacterium]|nr:nucleoside deaminase [Candidatus Saccharimonadia bacterium]
MDERDRRHLRQAIELARLARAAGNHPFGAVIVATDGTTLAEAGNSVAVDGPTGHAELNAVRAASAIDLATLTRATLYTSTEPCAMCAGAIYWSGIGRVVYGLAEDALRALTGDDPANQTMALPCRDVFARGQRQTLVEGPALDQEARAIHAGFWR